MAQGIFFESCGIFHYGAQISTCGIEVVVCGLFSCDMWAPEHVGLVVVACRLSGLILHCLDYCSFKF